MPLLQANSCLQGEQYRAAVSLQPIVWMMGFLKQGTLQRGFSYLTNGRYWPKAAIEITKIKRFE